MSRRIIFLSIGAIIILLGAGMWFLFFRSSAPFPVSTSSFGFPSAGNTTFSSGNGNTLTSQTTESSNSNEKIFNISPGPVTSAVFIQQNNPTTTIARFIMQDTGHVSDVPLDMSGVAPETISDVTIPGAQKAVWAQGGNAVLLQYVDTTNTIKTIYLGFTLSTSTTPSSPKEVQFLPDNILGLAVSPDGGSISYLLKNQSGGVNGYVAAVDGHNPRELFSIPFTQLLISWPTPQMIILQTKSAADTPGIVFEVGVKSGAIVPLLYGDGLTALANKDLSEILYQTRSNGVNLSYVHLLHSGGDVSVFDVFPEKCVWDALVTYRLYCAMPTQNVDASYLDAWHQGIVNIPDYIEGIDFSNGNTSSAIAVPGQDGGSQTSITQLTISPDDRYLMYISRGDRSLWGVRLTQ